MLDTYSMLQKRLLDKAMKRLFTIFGEYISNLEVKTILIEVIGSREKKSTGHDCL